MINKEEILKLPEIKNYRLLWHSTYWDGMMSGMLLYNDQAYWFSCFDDASDYATWIESDNINEPDLSPSEQLGFYRRFAVIELTDEQIAKAKYWNDLFCKYVGTYTNYDENGRPIIDDKNTYIGKDGIKFCEGARPPELHHIYFDEHKKEYGVGKKRFEDEFDGGKIIGWFHN